LIYLDIPNPNEEFLSKLTVKNDGGKTGKYTISNETNLYSIAIDLASKIYSDFFLETCLRPLVVQGQLKIL